jgi:carboxymethylenebutenolidase
MGRSNWIALVALASFSAAAAFAQDGKKADPAAPFGGLSEEEFKKLHQLKEGEAPAAKGTMVALADGTQAYLALPEHAQPGLPAVVVVHEWWGLNSHIKHWADRLTLTGRAALAVDLYGGKVATDRDQAAVLMGEANKDPDKAVKTLLAGFDFVKTDARVKAGKVASLGWCFGGGMSLRLAIHAPTLDAAVMYYGFPINDKEELAKIKAPLLGVFGNKDKAIDPAKVDAFDLALTQAGVVHTIHRYDADHGFANPSNAISDEKSAADAWTKVQKFLDEKLPVAAPAKK